MANQPQAGKSLDPAVIAGMAKAAQQQQHHVPHHAAPPSHLSTLIVIGVWLAFFGSMVAVFYTNR